MDFSLSKEQKDIKRAAAKFAKGEFQPELAQDCELNHRFPRELYKKAGELGFIGIDYPKLSRRVFWLWSRRLRKGHEDIRLYFS